LGKNVSTFKALKKLRNLLIHGNDVADEEYDDLTKPDFLRDIRIAEREKINLITLHIQSLELYIFIFLLIYTKESLMCLSEMRLVNS